MNDVWNILAKVAEPELGLNPVALGLVYDVEDAGSRLRVAVTTMTPGHTRAADFAERMRARLSAAFPSKSVEVALVWSPVWDRSMVVAAARRCYGRDQAALRDAA